MKHDVYQPSINNISVIVKVIKKIHNFIKYILRFQSSVMNFVVL